MKSRNQREGRYVGMNTGLGMCPEIAHEIIGIIKIQNIGPARHFRGHLREVKTLNAWSIHVSRVTLLWQQWT